MNMNGTDAILKTIMGYMSSQVLMTALRMELFTLLSKGRILHYDEIVTQLELNGRCAKDFLNCLVGMGYLSLSSEDTYTNTEMSETYLNRNRPEKYIGLGAIVQADRSYVFWSDLLTSLKTGKPSNETRNDEKFFEKLYSDPHRLSNFLGAMSCISMGPSESLSSHPAIDWSLFKNICDVGGARGTLGIHLVSKYDHLHYYNYDLTVVGDPFRKHIKEAFQSLCRPGLVDRCTFVPGNFFELEKFPLPKVDAFVFGHVLHNWNVNQRKYLLKMALDNLPAGGKVVVYEMMINNSPNHNVFGFMMSLNMLIETEGGSDYTGDDLIKWMTEVGFVDCSVSLVTDLCYVGVGTKI